MKKMHIIKIGGNIIDKDKDLHAFLAEFSAIPGPKILVHGGGKLASELSAKLGIETKMENGRRITDAETLKVVTMVYAGWINKSIVARLQSLHCNAVGLSGADGKCMLAEKRKAGTIDHGFAGDILPDGINAKFLQALLHSGITPVVAPITCDSAGQLLNTNADTIASALAGAMSKRYETHLIYCFEKNGVLATVDNDDSVIQAIDTQNFEKLKTEKVIAGGMIPKLDNAFKAKQHGVASVVIGHASNLSNLLKKEDHAGTYISA